MWCVCVYIFYKELSHMIMELAWWKSAMWVSRLEPQQSWWYRWSLLFGEASLFVLFGLSSDWVRPTHIYGGQSVLLRVPWFKCQSQQKHHPSWYTRLTITVSKGLWYIVSVSFFRYSLPLLYELLTSKGA